MSRNAQIKGKTGWLGRIGWLAIALLLPPTATAQSTNSLFSHSPAAETRVYLVEDPNATIAFQPQWEPIAAMVRCAITNLTGFTDPSAAWLSLVSTQDTVGIKVFSDPGPNSGTRRAVVAAVVQGLLAAGLKTNQIIVWDKRLVDLRLAGYSKLAEDFGIRLAGSADAGYDETAFYESALIGTLVWGDFEFGMKGEGTGRKSFVSKLVTQDMTKIINITPMMNHNQAGVAGHLFSLALGSVDNTKRFEDDASRLSVAVPELYALPSLSDRVVLNITDALICQYEGEERSLLHYATSLNQLRFSRDPVALDALSIQEMDHQRTRAGTPRSKLNRQLYSNAALLELGVNNLDKIEIIRCPPAQR